MIRLLNVSYSYVAGVRVLENLSLEIPPGVTLLLGPNGSGKSTILKIAAGVESPDAGRAEVDGLDLWRAEAESRRLLAYVPEQPDLSPYASIREILHLVCRLRNQPLQVAEEVLRRVSLEKLASRTVRELSMGQRRRITIAAAMIATPQNVLLDEPLEQMDRQLQDDLLAWIQQLAKHKSTVLIVTHELEPFVALANQVVAPVNGVMTMFAGLPSGNSECLDFLERAARGLLTVSTKPDLIGG